MKVHEVNFDRLVGPTHHYAGLAYGNEASMQHAAQRSNPKAAALQGLDKMEVLHRLGLKQGCLLPHTRPYMPLLEQLGFRGSEQRILEQVYQSYPQIFAAVFSCAGMYTANAGNMTPATDNADGHMHVTVANLASQLHRAIEASETLAEFKHILGNALTIHDPVPGQCGDEGAANHMRLAPAHDQPGVHIFVYGRALYQKKALPKHYPARQVLEAQEAIARTHGIKTPVIYLQQNPDVIDAGVFHNDVIAMSNETVLIVHEKAFLDDNAIDNILSACDFDLQVIVVSEEELSVSDAVRTYFFNSQLITAPSGHMHMILPAECEHHEKVQRLVGRILDADNPIEQAHYVDCKQSMHNGGGPACLRLRMQMDEAGLARMNQRHVLTDEMFAKLRACVSQYYPDSLVAEDLLDAGLRAQCERAVSEIKGLFKSV